jgi:hypothetical protein
MRSVRAALLSAFLLFFWTAPGWTQAPAKARCLIKGNVSSKGERIYHPPGCRHYASTVIDPRRGERWFCSEREAQEAGWRRTKVC